jgi:predicted RNA-binding protein with RPS1 domain
VVKKSENVEVVVLSVDKEARRVSLGLKQVAEDPWPIIAQKYTQNTICTGKVVRLLEKGVVVDLGDDLEGFVPVSQLGVDNLKKPADSFSEGDEIPLKATRVDIPNHRIVLSVKAYMSAQDMAIVDEYRAKHAPKQPTIGDVASEELKEAAESEVKAEQRGLEDKGAVPEGEKPKAPGQEPRGPQDIDQPPRPESTEPEGGPQVSESESPSEKAGSDAAPHAETEEPKGEAASEAAPQAETEEPKGEATSDAAVEPRDGSTELRESDATGIPERPETATSAGDPAPQTDEGQGGSEGWSNRPKEGGDPPQEEGPEPEQGDGPKID